MSPIHPHPPFPPAPPLLHSNLATQTGHLDGQMDDSETNSLIETPLLPLEAVQMVVEEVPSLQQHQQQYVYSLLPRQNEPIRHTGQPSAAVDNLY